MPGESLLSPPPTEQNDIPLPNSLVVDDTNGVEAARQRFAKKHRFLSLTSLRRARLKKSSRPQSSSVSVQGARRENDDQDLVSERQDTNPINLSTSSPNVEYDDSHDHYEWAAVYENQRGMTIFSTPYYSRLSLLPSDPSPFTLPNASTKRSEQPPITLENYPLPDGNWKWVSRCWMIDMRSNLGEVQHDGFEYNWMFRKHSWRADVGALSAGGWVRRRRWIRLMVRPAKTRRHHEDASDGTGTVPNTPDLSSLTSSTGHRHSMGSLPPSILAGSNYSNELADRWKDMNPDEVWLGDSIEANWERLHRFMRRFGRDGRKLEVWRLWLGYYHPEHKDKFSDVDLKGARREKQWTEDEGPLQSELSGLHVFSQESVAIAPRDQILPVLRQHGQTILRAFIYPDSRAQFLKLLALSDLLHEMNIPLANSLDIMTEIDFWSYANTVDADIPHTPPPLKSSIMAQQAKDLQRQHQAKQKAKKRPDQTHNQ